MLSHNLLLEEYPLAERDIRAISPTEWILDTEVCNYRGVGRFVMGLLDDVTIVDSPEFKSYIDEIVAKYR
jgi:hypothetical protein